MPLSHTHVANTGVARALLRVQDDTPKSTSTHKSSINTLLHRTQGAIEGGGEKWENPHQAVNNGVPSCVRGEGRGYMQREGGREQTWGVERDSAFNRIIRERRSWKPQGQDLSMHPYRGASHHEEEESGEEIERGEEEQNEEEGDKFENR